MILFGLSLQPGLYNDTVQASLHPVSIMILFVLPFSPACIIMLFELPFSPASIMILIAENSINFLYKKILQIAALCNSK